MRWPHAIDQELTKVSGGAGILTQAAGSGVNALTHYSTFATAYVSLSLCLL